MGAQVKISVERLQVARERMRIARERAGLTLAQVERFTGADFVRAEQTGECTEQELQRLAEAYGAMPCFLKGHDVDYDEAERQIVQQGFDKDIAPEDIDEIIAFRRQLRVCAECAKERQQ